MEQNTAPNAIRLNKVDMMSTQNLDMKQRRVINASDAQDNNDYTTLEQVNNLITSVNNSISALQNYLNQQISKLNNSVSAIPPPTDLGATPLVLGVTGGQIAFFTTNTSLAVIKQILNSYTPNNQGVSYSGIANSATGSVFAQVADLNTLRVAYQNLRVAFEDLRFKLQTSTLMG